MVFKCDVGIGFSAVSTKLQDSRRYGFSTMSEVEKRNCKACNSDYKSNIFLEIYYRKLIIFLEVLKCRQSLMFQGFPAFLVTEDVLKSP